MIVRSQCPFCGNVDMAPSSVHLTVADGGSRGAYSFNCPSCSVLVAKPADRKIVELLIHAGVNVDGWRRIGEAPPLTTDDLIDFHTELEEKGIEGFFA